MLRYVIEFDGTIILNNEYKADASPVIIDWFANVDLVIDNLDTKFIVNSHNLHALPFQVLEVTQSIVMLRPKRVGNATVKQTHSFFLFPKKYTVQIADATTTFFTIFDKGGEKRAIDLGAIIDSPKVESKNNKVELTAKNLKLVYDPHNNVIEKFERKEPISPMDSIPITFLKHVTNKEFMHAKNLLGFPITDAHLSQYFGTSFEILKNNYLENPNIVSIVTNGKVRNIKFEVQGNMITNLE